MSFTLWKFSLQWNWGSELRFFFCLSFLCGHCGPILRLFKRQALLLLSRPMSSPYSLSVACASFYLYFSFTHSAILFFFLSHSQSQSLSPFLFYVGFYVPMPSKDPVWLALSSFSPLVTLFVVCFLAEVHFFRDRSLTGILLSHTHGEHSLF